MPLARMQNGRSAVFLFHAHFSVLLTWLVRPGWLPVSYTVPNVDWGSGFASMPLSQRGLNARHTNMFSGLRCGTCAALRGSRQTLCSGSGSSLRARGQHAALFVCLRIWRRVGLGWFTRASALLPVHPLDVLLLPYDILFSTYSAWCAVSSLKRVCSLFCSAYLSCLHLRATCLLAFVFEVHWLYRATAAWT
jgi:hypothetical protein